MDLFDQTIRAIRDWFRHKERSTALRQYEALARADRLDRGSNQVHSRSRRNQTIILKEDTALELGHPSAGSCSGVLVTSDPALVRDGLITHIGPDISETDRDILPFAQIVICCYRGRDLEDMPYRIDRAASGSVQTEGYMIRSVPNLIWSRVSREAAASGLSLRDIGQRLISAINNQFEDISGTEVFFATTSREDVSELDGIIEIARDKLRKIQSFAVSDDGEYECTQEQDCEACPEQEVCDSIRDVIKLRKGDRLISFGPDGVEVIEESG